MFYYSHLEARQWLQQNGKMGKHTHKLSSTQRNTRLICSYTRLIRGLVKKHNIIYYDLLFINFRWLQSINTHENSSRPSPIGVLSEIETFLLLAHDTIYTWKTLEKEKEFNRSGRTWAFLSFLSFLPGDKLSRRSQTHHYSDVFFIPLFLSLFPLSSLQLFSATKICLLSNPPKNLNTSDLFILKSRFQGM